MRAGFTWNKDGSEEPAELENGGGRGPSSMREGGYGGGVQAGERLLGELDRIQTRLGEVVGDGAGRVTRLQRLAMLGEISGFVAHEFNNILTPLLAHAQVALRQPRDPERMALALERTVASVKRAAAVAESILELAKQEGASSEADGGGVPDKSPVSRETAIVVHESSSRDIIGRTDVRRCVRRAIDDAMGGLDGVAVEIEGGLCAAIGENELHQVLLNLVLNARRASTGPTANAASSYIDRIVVRGGAWRVPTMAPKCSYIDRYMPDLLKGPDSEPQESSDDTWCMVEVVDCGGGVGEAAVRALRGRGFKVVVVDGEGRGLAGGRERGDAPASEGVSRGGSGVESRGVSERMSGGMSGGAGLGLEISRRLVGRAGGWIEIESRAGVGTVVRVVLKRAMGGGSAGKRVA